MTIGEPRHGFPSFAGDIIAANQADFGKYPPIAGTPELRSAIAAWLDRRYGLADRTLSILPSTSFHFAARAKALSRRWRLPASTKAAIARPCSCQTPFIRPIMRRLHRDASPFSRRHSRHRLSAGSRCNRARSLDRRRSVLYCLSRQPAGRGRIRRLPGKADRLARTHGFYVFSDECYSEIYQAAPPPSALEVAAKSADLIRFWPSIPSRSALMRRASVRASLPGTQILSKTTHATGTWPAPKCPASPTRLRSALADEAHVERAGSFIAKISACLREAQALARLFPARWRVLPMA